MAVYYVDTSVLVKRHVTEPGSSWVQALFNATPPHSFITARISLAELYSALNRRVREGTVTRQSYAQILQAVQLSWPAHYEIVELTDALVRATRLLLEQHALRAYDAVQLVSALHAGKLLTAKGASAPVFLSADDRLLAAARAEGLATDNPNSHP